MNLNALLKAVPVVVTPGVLQTNHDDIVMYHRLAVQVHAAFRIEPEMGEHFGDLTKAMQVLVASATTSTTTSSSALDVARR
jgi:hypothetical protein